VADLVETDAFSGLELPFSAGDCRLEACAPAPIVAVAPWPGRREATDAALRGIGLAFPQPGRVIASGSARAVWAGRETAFLFGVPAPEGLEEHAALTDQSDGWAGLRLSGGASEAVLARLVPLDLRAAALAPGRAAHSLLNHMPCLIVRDAVTVFEIHVYRSMAGTAVHELSEAMRDVAARAALR
jgi:heterotetrameric sarcosine oxidase gamma subunit